MNKSKMQAGDRVIGNGEPCFVIAEAGVNHNGDLELAKRLIEAAARAGADAIKFQTFKTDLLLTPNTPKADYQLVGTCHNESQFDMLNRLELSQDAHWILRDLAVKLGLVFLSTPFDEKSADFLEELGVPLFKMSSGELTNHPLLQWVAKKGRPMIVSTGMANLEEIKDALKVIENNGCHAVSILHCTSSYPTLPIDCNLRAMKQLNDTFGMTIGYSDHTLGTEVALAAVAMNARILEKHLTLDRKMLGPDHQMSLEPQEFTGMMKAIRNIEKAFGDGMKRPMPSEISIREIARKSLVMKKNLPAGTILEKDHLIAKRPGQGIPPSKLLSVVGHVLKTSKKADALIQWEDID